MTRPTASPTRRARSSAYLSDLDHTLLDRDARLSDRTRDGLLRLLGEGVAFSVASARSAPTMRSMFQGVRLTLPVIEFGGAHISDLASGEHYVTHAVAPEVVAHTLGVARDTGIDPFISSNDGVADRLSHRPPQNGGQAWYVEDRRNVRDPRLRCLERLDGVVDEQVVCVTYMGSVADMDRVEAAIGVVEGARVRRFENGYSPGWHWLTVQSPLACKGEAARAWRRLTGLDDHELVVFGDAENDLELFDVADRAVAVANALPALLARATHTIGAHHEDSVVRYVLAEHGMSEDELP